MKATTFLIALATILSAFISNALLENESRPPYPVAMKACTARTGLKSGEIINFKHRNEDCTLDCYTQQGETMSSFEEEGSLCSKNTTFPSESFARCHLGRCKTIEEGLDYPADLFSIKVQIKRAYLPEKYAESQIIVKVRVRHFGDPVFVEGNLVCQSSVGNGKKPSWATGICRPPPMKLITVLHFIIHDYVGPNKTSESIGMAVESVEYLLNRGPLRLPLWNTTPFRRDESNCYVEVDISGEKFKRPYELRTKTNYSRLSNYHKQQLYDTKLIQPLPFQTVRVLQP